MTKSSSQVTGNTGLYLVCYELSKRGWNVVPTSRNARGVDVLIYSQDGQKRYTIQVKALSDLSAVPFGSNLENQIADFFVICTQVSSNAPRFFIAETTQLVSKVTKQTKEAKDSYWLEKTDYLEFEGLWEKIGNGF